MNAVEQDMSQSYNMASLPQEAKFESANAAEMAGAQMAENQIFSLGLGLLTGGASVGLTTALDTANTAFNIAQMAELGAATIDMGHSAPATVEGAQVSSAFTPSPERNDWSMDTLRGSKANDIRMTRSATRPSFDQAPKSATGFTFGMKSRNAEIEMSYNSAKPMDLTNMSNLEKKAALMQNNFPVRKLG